MWLHIPTKRQGSILLTVLFSDIADGVFCALVAELEFCCGFGWDDDVPNYGVVELIFGTWV